MENILNNQHFISVPRNEFERMELQIKNIKKNDSNINLNVCINYNYGDYYKNFDYVFNFNINQQDELHKDLLDKINNHLCLLEAKFKETSTRYNNAEKNYNEKLIEVDSQLNIIKSKWWYKLFSKNYLNDFNFKKYSL